MTRLPEWIRARFPGGEGYNRLKGIMRDLRLNTVCEDAHCPNIGECWNHGTATFMILGDTCTRGCRYCAVAKGKPVTLDLQEPARVADAVEKMELRHAVITSVDRDDLPDGGAFIFAETVRQIRKRTPNCYVEVLIPDFQGDAAALRTVMESRPDILNHNTETVPRLYPTIRLGGDYQITLELLRRAKQWYPGSITKTGIMLGLGESDEELEQVIRDLVSIHVDILTMGQYLQPTKKHAAVEKFYHPDEFRTWKIKGEAMGIGHVEAGPLVRSSYHAAEQMELLQIR
ncbi:MAG: lipoyl synthase [Acidobacteria bacterium]|nr:MAG: lipoyl synthase [Acidobacteriota bacterium]